MEKKIDISLNIILRVLMVVIIVAFLYMIKDVIALFLVAVIITASLNPVIRKIQTFHCSRTLAVAFVYVVFFTGIGLIISSIAPSLINQFEEFFAKLPELTTNFIPDSFNVSDKISSINLEKNFISSLGGIFSDFVTGVISVLAVISMSFYMSLQENGLKQAIITVTPKKYEKYAISLIDRIYRSFGRWMIGQLITMVFVSILYYIVLSVMGVPFAIVLALLGGLLEIIPYFGPIIASVPAIVLGFSESSTVGLIILVAYLLINLIENYFLVPKIMNKAVGLNPVVVILALLIGVRLGGMIGLFLAVPLAGAISVFVKDFLNKENA
ncbi:MAG: AI-2E family transporter [Candidatus Moranbacteria bacterium]|nr:AI-2E family transporter [Candidatus Moranbacteria bacterium]